MVKKFLLILDIMNQLGRRIDGFICLLGRRSSPLYDSIKKGSSKEEPFFYPVTMTVGVSVTEFARSRGTAAQHRLHSSGNT
jgi:hypothetical protein